MVDLWLTRFVPISLIVIRPVKYRLFLLLAVFYLLFRKNNIQPFFNSSIVYHFKYQYNADYVGQTWLYLVMRINQRVPVYTRWGRSIFQHSWYNWCQILPLAKIWFIIWYISGKLVWHLAYGMVSDMCSWLLKQLLSNSEDLFFAGRRRVSLALFFWENNNHFLSSLFVHFWCFFRFVHQFHSFFLILWIDFQNLTEDNFIF